MKDLVILARRCLPNENCFSVVPRISSLLDEISNCWNRKAINRQTDIQSQISLLAKCWNEERERERSEKRKQHFWFGKLPLKMDTFLAKIIANRTLFSTSTYSIVRESVSLEETYDSETPVQLSTTVKIFSRQFCRWRK